VHGERGTFMLALALFTHDAILQQPNNYILHQKALRPSS
jgi:hypothetical protein